MPCSPRDTERLATERAAAARRSSLDPGNAEELVEDVGCALCGETAYDVMFADCPDRLLRVPGRFDVVRCRHCGLARTSPRPTPKAMGAYYPDSYSFFTVQRTKRGAAYAFLRDVIRLPYRLRYGNAELRPPTPGRSRFLDIGSGAGFQLEEMAALGWDPWGVEPNADLARRTAERLGLPENRILPRTAEEVDFPDGSFELVTMSHVLEHVHNPRAVLAAVSRWLVPDGHLRLWLPDFGSLEARIFGRLWHGLDVPRHLYHFSRETLSALLDATGFRMERAIPQCQGNMLTGSVKYAFDTLRRRAPVYREPRALHYALLPVASTLLALGEGGCLDVTARKKSSDLAAIA